MVLRRSLVTRQHDSVYVHRNSTEARDLSRNVSYDATTVVLIANERQYSAWRFISIAILLVSVVGSLSLGKEGGGGEQ